MNYTFILYYTKLDKLWKAHLIYRFLYIINYNKIRYNSNYRFLLSIKFFIIYNVNSFINNVFLPNIYFY